MEAHFLSLSKDIQENQLPQEEPSFDSQSERMEPFMLGCDTVADTDTKAAAPLFPHEQVKDFKHVVYNLLALHSNDPVNHNLVRPIEVIQNGVKRKGFQLDAMQSPETVFAELYARYIRGVDIHNLDKSSPIIQDLYKYYSRSAFELLVKYFEKVVPLVLALLIKSRKTNIPTCIQEFLCSRKVILLRLLSKGSKIFQLEVGRRLSENAPA